MIAAIAVPNRRPFAPAVLFLVVLAHVLVLSRLNSAAAPGAFAHARSAPIANVVVPLVMMSLAPVSAALVRRGSETARQRTDAAPAAGGDKVSATDVGAKVAASEPVAVPRELSSIPLTAENLAALDGVRDVPPAITQPVEHRVARRSRIFGGGFPTPHNAINEPTIPLPSARPKGAPLADYVREGVARGAYLIGSELARSGDGRCEVQMNSGAGGLRGESPDDGAAPRVTCSSSELAAASERLSAADIASLATWLRAGLVRSIEFNLRDGRVDLAIH